jgi:hypothetical protein
MVRARVPPPLQLGVPARESQLHSLDVERLEPFGDGGDILCRWGSDGIDLSRSQMLAVGNARIS